MKPRSRAERRKCQLYFRWSRALFVLNNFCTTAVLCCLVLIPWLHLGCSQFLSYCYYRSYFNFHSHSYSTYSYSSPLLLLLLLLLLLPLLLDPSPPPPPPSPPPPPPSLHLLIPISILILPISILLLLLLSLTLTLANRGVRVKHRLPFKSKAFEYTKEVITEEVITCRSSEEYFLSL